MVVCYDFSLISISCLIRFKFVLFKLQYCSLLTIGKRKQKQKKNIKKKRKQKILVVSNKTTALYY